MILLLFGINSHQKIKTFERFEVGTLSSQKIRLDGIYALRADEVIVQQLLVRVIPTFKMKDLLMK